MKKIIYTALIITSFMLLLPFSVLSKDSIIESGNILEVKASVTENQDKKDVFRVYDKETDKVTVMEAENYIFGVVAAEMPALYETEALKAQAVAAYTYACYKRKANEAKEYDITTDYTVDQSFKSFEKARSDWGEKADIYEEKIKSAVKKTLGQKLCVKGEPILAVYHAVSCGITYDAKEVWGKEISYLQSVPSEGDKLSENYLSEMSFSKDDLKTKLSKVVEIDENEIFSNLKTNSSGLVNTVAVCGKEVTGAELRNALDLPSSNFTFEVKDDLYVFTVKGKGHGIGMSQNGADYMAKQGYSYTQILEHYYTGCELVKG